MDVAKVTFIPHHANNHWPLALRHRTLAYVSSFLVVTKIIAISALALAPNTAELSTITEGRMVQLTNDARIKAGLPALAVSSALAQAAKLKGQDMLKNQYFAHISPSGVTPWFWMKKAGYEYTVAGENLAIDFLDAEEVISAWLNSPTHKANLLHSEYTQTGIAVVSGEFQGGTSIIVVHMFGKPLKEETPAAPEESAPVVASPTPAPEVAGIKKSNPTPSPTPGVRTPRISLLHAPVNEQDVVSLRAEGDAGYSLVLLIDNQERSITTLPPSGSQDISLSAKNLRSGTLIARAFTRSVDGIQSKPSLPISFVNPGKAPIEYTLALSPAFDRQVVALVGASSGEEGWQIFSASTPITINAHAVNVLPSFATQHSEAAKSFSASIVHAVRQATSLILIVVALLLLLAILIRIKVQHPALIMHASMVIFLAAVLLIA